MKIIGLTGSIGMGKTETAKMFAEQHIPVFDSDEIVHKLLGSDGDAVESVAKEFQETKIKTHIDRKKLGDIVFGNEKALNKLEKILHPLVAKMREDFVKQASEKGADMVVLDIPLLFEKDYDQECDYTVVVTAPYEVQKERVLSRKDMTEGKFLHILKQQIPDSEKRRRADFIIQTDLGFDHAKNQVKEIIETIRKR
ncbi:MAG: dephospho-CoA kinase [Proteobacteria bacterium]|jgi:dephospho-CoA kinase|nr:dephospho-CoA kinase [Pseudomonadota bacterium]